MDLQATQVEILWLGLNCCRLNCAHGMTSFINREKVIIFCMLMVLKKLELLWLFTAGHWSNQVFKSYVLDTAGIFGFLIIQSCGIWNGFDPFDVCSMSVLWLPLFINLQNGYRSKAEELWTLESDSYSLFSGFVNIHRLPAFCGWEFKKLSDYYY